MEKFEALCKEHMRKVCDENPDPSHDLMHVERVVSVAKMLALREGANLQVVVPAAYLHDCVYISKADPRRKESSQISGERALQLLQEWGYPSEHFPAIRHAIEAHSFSARILAETLEAKVVQDADRLDAMGAIGIFRCFAFSGLANRSVTEAEAHFHEKLLKLQSLLHTKAAQAEGEKRQQTMLAYLSALRSEVAMLGGEGQELSSSADAL